MAKRRKLEAPSADDLNRIEEEFRRETSGRGMVAPITQVAADAAAHLETQSPAARTEQARFKADSERLDQLRADGLVMTEIAVDQIEADAMIRDRNQLDEDEMLELRTSIAGQGLRLPIEVFELPTPAASGARYGLLSGYRRLKAVRGLLELTEQTKYTTIRSVVRPRTDADDAFVAMVEENEVRSDLSHFERGRIAVIAAQQGAFVNAEEAINRLYASGSKAKRSKVRSFAMIFEELGDLLEFPEQLTEKRGLRIAAVLRSGGEAQLRDALAHSAGSAQEEWDQIETVVDHFEAQPKTGSRGGRPSKPKSGAIDWRDADTIETSSGITIRRGADSQGYLLRLEGQGLSTDLMDSLMREIQVLLEKP